MLRRTSHKSLAESTRCAWVFDHRRAPDWPAGFGKHAWSHVLEFVFISVHSWLKTEPHGLREAV